MRFSNKVPVAILEVLFLVLFWAWVLSAVLFLRNTFLPRMPLAVLPTSWPLPFEPVRFQATDGLWLSGWKIMAQAQAPWIILCHGLGANRSDLLDIAAALSRAGYNLLVFDFRAHGESQGRVTSFGWREQRDLEGALAFLGRQPEIPERPYGVFGISMGGAVAVMVAARDERLGAVAVDSIYPNLEESIAHHIKLLYRLPRIPFLLFVSSTYRIRFGVWPRQMSPLDAVSHISPRALLVIHGGSDPRMPKDDATRLFEAAQEPKQLWIIEEADHLGGLQADPETYLQKLVGFFDSCLKQ